jgi:ribosome-binding factor A
MITNIRGKIMGAYRQSRINEEIMHTLSEILMDVKDYRLRDVVVSITGVVAAPDLSTARVYYSYVGSRDKKEVKQGLVSAHGYIRSRLAREINLRQTPELLFIYDESIEHGAHIAKLLDMVKSDLVDEGENNDD